VSRDLVTSVFPLGFPWTTFDPFLFCVHHDDAYPPGNDDLGPAASLSGRQIGMDFEGKDGWRMYHGDVVPGFPRHPHRGFETVTIARRGFIDHSDSLGATARFGRGDVQWMTAGRGIVHAEMFPLLQSDAPNPAELFQIWLNLPKADKMVEPHFSMLWSERIPHPQVKDDEGHAVEITVVAGSLAGHTAPPPPPSSWASRSDAHVAIWTLKLPAGARFTLPPAPAGVDRTIYFVRGGGLRVGDVALGAGQGARLRGDLEAPITATGEETEVLVLQGRPIGEPVVHYGPFVMTSPEEIQQAILDYRRTEYGGWPWPSDGPVHAKTQRRFAIHADGHREDAG
jgi:redox-sensitive bicupin YhaK (pirin superfamily)